MQIPLFHCVFPWFYLVHRQYQNGPREGWGSQGVPSSWQLQTTPDVDPLLKLPTARETAELLLHVLGLLGLPHNIVSDRGPQFTAKFWAEFCRLLGISVSLSSRFHPQTNGQTEELLLWSRDPASWARNAVLVEYAYNSLPSSATRLTPFQTVYGYQPNLFSTQETEAVVPSSFTMVRRCHLEWRGACQALICSVQSYEKRANKYRSPAPRYLVGQRVWLSTADLPLHLENRKLPPQFTGPFPITKVLNLVLVRLRLARSLRIHPTFPISTINPALHSNLVSPPRGHVADTNTGRSCLVALPSCPP